MQREVVLLTKMMEFSILRCLLTQAVKNMQKRVLLRCNVINYIEVFMALPCLHGHTSTQLTFVALLAWLYICSVDKLMTIMPESIQSSQTISLLT